MAHESILRLGFRAGFGEASLDQEDLQRFDDAFAVGSRRRFVMTRAQVPSSTKEESPLLPNYELRGANTSDAMIFGWDKRTTTKLASGGTQPGLLCSNSFDLRSPSHWCSGEVALPASIDASGSHNKIFSIPLKPLFPGPFGGRRES
ncbi:uncharacterized protein LOC115322303 isoform X4 [Ixodes scapularis]|uniref:uncharacterized protein LOC115322303 isoform X4 n=1 Tax=Ixodes scapularis TaxID=6945 RepID=UPI001A9DBBB4|nr:uncharacterized protein LOC115322303 isoform X4 [Ixodes scapularis]